VALKKQLPCSAKSRGWYSRIGIALLENVESGNQGRSSLSSGRVDGDIQGSDSRSCRREEDFTQEIFPSPEEVSEVGLKELLPCPPEEWNLALKKRPISPPEESRLAVIKGIPKLRIFYGDTQ
jgi:hypothetical protein